MKLSDLRVSIDVENVDEGVMLGDLRPATIEDLIEVLRMEGYVVLRDGEDEEEV